MYHAVGRGGGSGAYQEDELFCLSVAQTLKRLPAPRRSLLKVQILQLIHDIEFGGHS